MKIFLLNMAKLGAARGFYLVYLYTCELYPTEIRSTAVGCSSVCARVGALIGFLMAALARYWRPLPLVRH